MFKSNNALSLPKDKRPNKSQRSRSSSNKNANDSSHYSPLANDQLKSKSLPKNSNTSHSSEVSEVNKTNKISKIIKQTQREISPNVGYRKTIF